ncbi:MAG: DUF58 domain-containing protein [Gemmatimonadetes bacterium]|nr:DUF58 domain-containing protein [Gemmatimonadota bacterium]
MTAPTGIPGARFLDPATLARIDNLELLARTVVDGFINGLHHSPYLGLSVDFAEHRAYMPGDDIRRIDWRLFARSDRFYVKEFEADTNANVSILMDISPSMSFRGEGRAVSKLDYARYLAACLAWFSRQQRDRVGIVTFDADVVDRVPPSAKHLNIVLHTIDRITSGKQGTLRTPLSRVAESFRRPSILALISDLYEDPAEVVSAVNLLRAKGNDLIVFQIMDPSELTFPFDRPANFEDLESGERIPLVPDQLREQYHELMSAHLKQLKQRFTDNQIDYALFDTSQPLDYALFHFLSNRERMSRVR